MRRQRYDRDGRHQEQSSINGEYLVIGYSSGKTYSQDRSIVYNAALKSVEKLNGQMLASKPNDFRFEVRFDKTLLGKVLGERTNLTCSVQSDGQQSKVLVDAYPLDALRGKLMFGARKGVTQEIINLFKQHLENNLM